MFLTGFQIVEMGIVQGAVSGKVDDKLLPSYGPDGCGYTCRGEFPPNAPYDDGEYDNPDYFWLSPFKSCLFKTLEIVHMPNNMCGLSRVKTTYSRQGIVGVIDGVTEPGYNGKLTIRFFNSNSSAVRIFRKGGFSQIMVAPVQGLAQYDGRYQGGS